LEITYLPYRQLADPQTVAHTFFLAHSFRGDQIISDPTGYLRRLQQHVSAHFGEPAEIRLRVENVLAKIVSGVASVDDDAPWQDRVVSWMFPTSLTSVAVLVAAQRNPTVRLRYLNARTALVELGVSEFYVRLLDLLGCTHLGPHQVQRHLDRLAVVFDRAADVARTPFFFSGDVTAFSRPVAIQGSQDLIDAGDHREAVFWIIATYARCLTILDADASDRGAEMAHGFHEAVAELLSVDSSTDLRGRCDDVRRFLPQLRSAAERILTR
jgi:hypothetical protein